MGLHGFLCYQRNGSLYTAFSTLTRKNLAVSLCCTIPEVAFAGRYPASCPVMPVLSSPGPPFGPASRDYISYFLSKRNIRQLIIIPQTLFLVHPQIADPTKPYKTAFHTHQKQLPHKLPQNRILGNILNRHSDKIIQKLQQPLCLLVFRLSLLNLEQSGSAYTLSTASSYTSAELNITSAFS